jgi:hypothetical protein
MAPPDVRGVDFVATRIEGALLLALGACAGRLTAQAAGWVVPLEHQDIDALYRRHRTVYGQR